MLFTDFISVSSWMLSSQDESIFYDFFGLLESNQCKLQPQNYRKVWKGRASAALRFSVCQWRSIHNLTKGTLIFIWYHLILLPVLILLVYQSAQEIVHWIPRKIQVHKKLVFVFVLTFKTIFVHNMLWTFIFHGIQWTITRHIVD